MGGKGGGGARGSKVDRAGFTPGDLAGAKKRPPRRSGRVDLTRGVIGET